MKRFPTTMRRKLRMVRRGEGEGEGDGGIVLDAVVGGFEAMFVCER